MNASKKVIVVTGGNRGIGQGILELFCQQPDVNNKTLIMASRNKENSLKKIEELKSFYPASAESLHYLNLDLSCNKSIENFCGELKQNFRSLDVLYNNAGIMHKHYKPILEREKREADLNDTFQVNFWGLLNLTENLIPIIQDGGHIVNTSSAIAKFRLSKRLVETFMDPHLKTDDFEKLFNEYKNIFVENKIVGSEWDDKQPIYGCYSVSKMFVGAYTRSLMHRFNSLNKNIKVNCVTPGWCKTDMGGADAPRTYLKGAETAVWLESLPLEKNNALTGNFYYDKKSLTWH